MALVGVFARLLLLMEKPRWKAVANWLSGNTYAGSAWGRTV